MTVTYWCQIYIGMTATCWCQIYVGMKLHIDVIYVGMTVTYWCQIYVGITITYWCQIYVGMTVTYWCQIYVGMTVTYWCHLCWYDSYIVMSEYDAEMSQNMESLLSQLLTYYHSALTSFCNVIIVNNIHVCLYYVCIINILR